GVGWADEIRARCLILVLTKNEWRAGHLHCQKMGGRVSLLLRPPGVVPRFWGRPGENTGETLHHGPLLVAGGRRLVGGIWRLHAHGRLPRLLNGGQEQADQDRDNRDHYQQFKKAKACMSLHATSSRRGMGCRRIPRMVATGSGSSSHPPPGIGMGAYVAV